MPDPAAMAAYEEAARPCRGIRTWSAEVAVSGRTGGQRLRGRLIAGFERPGNARIEGVAPFGAPLFVLTARHDRAVLVLPRDRRVLVGAPFADVMEALAGVSRGADDLVALLGGCVVADGTPVAGFRSAARWLRADLDRGVSVYLRRDAGAWRIVRASQADGPRPNAWTVDYSEFASGFPGRVGLRGVDAYGTASTDLVLRVTQPDVNIDLPSAAFDAAAHEGFDPLTMDELRATGPLGEAGAPPRR